MRRLAEESEARQLTRGEELAITQTIYQEICPKIRAARAMKPPSVGNRASGRRTIPRATIAEVLKLIAGGRTSRREIARRLRVDRKTVAKIERGLLRAA